MPGLFDDLIPAQQAAGAGLFDDLVPAAPPPEDTSLLSLAGLFGGAATRPAQPMATPEQASEMQVSRETFTELPDLIRPMAAQSAAGIVMEGMRQGDPTGFLEMLLAPGTTDTAMGVAREATADAQAFSQKRDRTFAEDVIQNSAASLLGSSPALATGILTRNPALATAAIAPGTFGQKQAELVGQGMSPDQARPHAAFQAAVEVGTEFLPFAKLLERAPGGAQLLQFFAREVPGEVTAHVLQQADDVVAQQQMRGEPVDLMTALQKGTEGLPLTIASTILSGGAQSGIIGAANLAQDAVAKQRTDSAVGDTLDAVLASTDRPLAAAAQQQAVQALSPENAQFVMAPDAPTAQAAPAATTQGLFEDLIPGLQAQQQQQPVMPAPAAVTYTPPAPPEQPVPSEPVAPEIAPPAAQQPAAPILSTQAEAQQAPLAPAPVAEAAAPPLAPPNSATGAPVSAAPEVTTPQPVATNQQESGSPTAGSVPLDSPVAESTDGPGVVTKHIRPKRPRPPPVPEKDTLLEWLAKHPDGLDFDEAKTHGLDPADMNDRAYKLRGAYSGFRRGGMKADDIARAAAEAGYPVTDENGNYSGAILIDRISEAFGGKKVFSINNTTWMDDLADEKARIAQEQADYEAEANAMSDDDLATLIDESHETLSESFNDDRIYQELVNAEEARIAAEAEAEIDALAARDREDAPAAGGSNVAGNDGIRAGPAEEAPARGAAPDAAEVAGANGAPALELNTYTEQDLADRARRAKEAEDARKAAEKKAEIDAGVSGFGLTGSTQQIDEGAAVGQNDMFGATGARREQVDPPRATAGATESAGETGIAGGNLANASIPRDTAPPRAPEAASARTAEDDPQRAAAQARIEQRQRRLKRRANVPPITGRDTPLEPSTWDTLFKEMVRIRDGESSADFMRRQLAFAQRMRTAGISVQLRAAQQFLVNRYRFKAVELNGLNGREALDVMLDMANNLDTMSGLTGLPREFMGFDGALTLNLAKKIGTGSSARGTLGMFSFNFQKGFEASVLSLARRNDSFAHEWAHALDLYILMGLGSVSVGVTGKIGPGLDPFSKLQKAAPEVHEAFMGLMRAMHYNLTEEQTKRIGQLMAEEPVLNALIDKLKEKVRRYEAQIRDRDAREKRIRELREESAAAARAGDKFTAAARAHNADQMEVANRDALDKWQRATDDLKAAEKKLEAVKAERAEILQKSASDYLKGSTAADRMSGGQYFSNPWEMMARATEAWVAAKLQSTRGTESISAPDEWYAGGADGAMKLVYPNDDDRVRIFGAIENLMAAIGRKAYIKGTPGLDRRPGAIDGRLLIDIERSSAGNLKATTIMEVVLGERDNAVRIATSATSAAKSVLQAAKEPRAQAFAAVQALGEHGRATAAITVMTARGTLLSLMKKYADSPEIARELRTLLGKIATDPGSGKSQAITIEEESERRSKARNNLLFRVLDRYQIDPNDAAQQRQLHAYLTRDTETLIASLRTQKQGLADAMREADKQFGRREAMLELEVEKAQKRVDEAKTDEEKQDAERDRDSAKDAVSAAQKQHSKNKSWKQRTLEEIDERLVTAQAPAEVLSERVKDAESVRNAARNATTMGEFETAAKGIVAKLRMEPKNRARAERVNRYVGTMLMIAGRDDFKKLGSIAAVMEQEAERLRAEQERRKTMLDMGSVPKNVKDAGRAIRELYDQEIYYNAEAGVDLGVSNGYLPRVMLKEKLETVEGRKAFVKAATTVYEDLKRAESTSIRLAMARESAKEKPDGAKLRELSDQLKDVEALQPAYQAEQWLLSSRYTDFFVYDRSTPPANYQMTRRLPESADRLMAEFYETNVAQITQRYIQSSSRRAAYSRRFGNDHQLLEMHREQLMAGGIDPADLEIVDRAVKIATGAYRPTLEAGQTPVSDVAFAWGTMALLPRAVFASLSEPLVAGLRTGEAAVGWKTLGATVRGVFQSRDMLAQRELAEYLGIITKAEVDQMIHNRMYMLEGEHSRTQKWLTHFFKTTGLHALTNWQRVASFRSGQFYLQTWARRYLGTDQKARDAAMTIFAELGIASSDFQSFSEMIAKGELRDLEWFLEPGQEKLKGAYAGALNRFVDQVIQNPKAVDRPVMAFSPTGRLIMSIMGFNFTYQRNVLIRTFKQIRNSGPASAQAAAALAVAPSVLSIMLGAALAQALRDVWDDPWDLEKLEKRWVSAGQRPIVYLADLWSRAGGFGAFDSLYQLAMSTVGSETGKYQKPLAETAAGAILGFYLANLDDIRKGIGDAIGDVTPTSNNAERKAWRGLYNILVSPAVSVALATANVAGVAGFVMQTQAGNFAMREGFAEFMAPKTPQELAREK